MIQPMTLDEAIAALLAAVLALKMTAMRARLAKAELGLKAKK